MKYTGILVLTFLAASCASTGSNSTNSTFTAYCTKYTHKEKVSSTADFQVCNFNSQVTGSNIASCMYKSGWKLVTMSGDQCSGSGPYYSKESIEKCLKQSMIEGLADHVAMNACLMAEAPSDVNSIQSIKFLSPSK